MGLIVQKFGGSSVKDRDRIFNVARIVMNTRNAGNDVVVVVSAQGDTTDDLIAKAAEITSDPSHREMDMLLAAGEEISISLLTMALQELGVSAISLTGWQAGFNTDRAYSKARIKRLDTCLLYTSRRRCTALRARRCPLKGSAARRFPAAGGQTRPAPPQGRARPAPPAAKGTARARRFVGFA